MRAYRELDNDRLAYVAFTRARDSLTVTSSWWGFGHTKPRDPHRYLTTLHDHFAGLDIEIPRWVSEPDLEPVSESISTESDDQWPQPVPPVIVESLKSQAHYVQSAQSNDSEVSLVELSNSELELVEAWQRSLDRLREEDARLHADTRRVSLPASIGASTYMRALREPEELAKDLARPMPRRPSVVAEKGTIVHSLIEAHYKPKTLLDFEDLDDSLERAGIGSNSESDADVQELTQVFRTSRFAELMPVAVEQPFTISVGVTTITGYIDAIFEIEGRFLVVDW